MSKKTEIAQFESPDSKFFFVISNPPEDKDSLLSLVFNHFQSFAPSDTIEKYAYYIHEYYKENTFTRRGYKAKSNKDDFLSYIRSREKDLLIKISVDTEFTVNTKFRQQKIVFYKKGKEEEEIYKILKEEMR